MRKPEKKKSPFGWLHSLLMFIWVPSILSKTALEGLGNYVFKSMRNNPRGVTFKKDASGLGFVPAQELPLPIAYSGPP